MTNNAEENVSSKLSETLWGHRFTAGQKGTDYTLEFMNVLLGANYKLESDYYVKKKMLLFRQFIFEGYKSGNKKDSHVNFSEEKYQELMEGLNCNVAEVEDIRSFFRNMTIRKSAKDNRSWYAHMLFPLNETLLFFELRDDKGSIQYERNFFSRGGELYYLMLSYGTRDSENLRLSLEQRLREYTKGNENIGNLVKAVSTSLGESCELEPEDPKNVFLTVPAEKVTQDVPKTNAKNAPTLPADNLPIYTQFAEDLHALLGLKIDSYEMFELMTALICHQLYRYLLGQSANVINEKPYFVLDCMNGEDTHIKRIASNSYKRHVQIIQESFATSIKERVDNSLPDVSVIANWKSEAAKVDNTDINKKYQVFFADINQASRRAPIKNTLIDKLENEDEQQALTLLRMELETLYLAEIKEKQQPIIRTLGEDGGFLTPGNYKRYVMGDTLLNALVYAVLDEREQMSFADFLSALYERYHIVIGPTEATVSGVYEKEGINRKSYDANEKRLRARLKRNGLLQEYSDATALVCNPYKVGRFM